MHRALCRRVAATAAVAGAVCASGCAKRWCAHKPQMTSVGAEMKAKGFVNSTPNFSVDFGEAPDVADLVTDIETVPAVAVDHVRDIYGPWLVMTEDLQGELFVDHDKFVFYRPANGLGYGIGTIDIIDAGPTGTAFTMQLESYTYQQTASVAPQFGIELSMTGMVKKVISKSTDYTTFSLVGIWKKENRNIGGVADVHARKSKGDVEEKEEQAMSGQFNMAKLSPWNPDAAQDPWKPNDELVNVFRGVFPRELALSSHLRRAAERGATSSTTVRAAAEGGPRHIDLEPYAVGSIPGIYYIPNYLSTQEEAEVAAMIKATPAELKSKIKKRTVQEWGCSMCEECKQSFVADANMPPWVQQCTDMLVHDGIFTPTTFPNSVRIHEYEQGEGIGPHCDGPIYVPIVTVLSLASTSVMNFYPRREPYHDHPMDHYNDTFKFSEGEIGSQSPLQTVVMEPGSLLVFSGEAYYFYPHGISDKAVDDLSPEVSGDVVNRRFLSDPHMTHVTRTYRSSITTRNLMTRCSHQPARAEYGMKRAWYLYRQIPVPESLFPSAPARRDAAALPVAAPRISSSSASSTLSGPLSAEDLRRWERKLDALSSQQEALNKSIEELRKALVLSVSSSVTFRKETSTVLNHLSSAVLEMDNKVDDVIDALNDAKKD